MLTLASGFRFSESNQARPFSPPMPENEGREYVHQCLQKARSTPPYPTIQDSDEKTIVR